LEACRWHCMKLLADECEERGDDGTAAGWRWLALVKRWPETIRSHLHLVYSWRLDLANPDPSQSEAVVNFAVRRFGRQLAIRSLSRLLESTARAAGGWLQGDVGTDPGVRGERFDHAGQAVQLALRTSRRAVSLRDSPGYWVCTVEEAQRLERLNFVAAYWHRAL